MVVAALARSDVKYTMPVVVPTVTVTPKAVKQGASADTSALALVLATAVMSTT